MAIFCIHSGIAMETNLLPGDTSFEAGPEQWLGGRSVARKDAPYGRYVLELSKTDNHSQIYYGLIEPDQEFTLSFSARCPDGPTKVGFSVWHVRYAPLAFPPKIKLNNQWQRYKIHIKPKSMSHSMNCNAYFKVKLLPDVKIELDGLMLTKSRETTYVPGTAPVIGQSQTGSPGNILMEQGKPPVIKIGAAANRAPVNGKLTCKTVDYYGRICQSVDRKVNLKPGESIRFDYPVLKQKSRGYYLIKAELCNSSGTPVATFTQPFGVAPRPVTTPPDKSFFGIHPAGDRVEMSALPGIGVKWLRSFYSWRYLERKGKIRPIESSYGDFAIMASIQLLKGAPKKYLKNNALKDFKAMDKFLMELVRESSPQVKCWEIENEPNLTYSSLLKKSESRAAAYYCKLATSAGAAIKKANPGSEVAVLACSGTATDTFVVNAIPKDPRVFDIVSVHPYTSARYIGPGMNSVAPDAYIRRTLLQKATKCKGKQLWAGEVGWAYDFRVPVESAYIRTFSDYVARALILMRSIPQVKKVMWFKAQGCYERNYYQYGLWRSEFEPLAAALFYADIANRLDNAKPFKPIFESDIRIYTFVAADGRPFAAVWRYKGDVDELLIPAPLEKVKLTDMFGQPVKSSNRKGETLIPLSSSPVWLEIDGTNPDSLVKMLSSIHVNEVPAIINVYYRDDKRVAGCLRNNLPQSQNITLKLASGNASVKEMAKFALQLGAARAFSIALPKANGPYQLLVSSPTGVVKYDDPGNYLACPPASSWKKLLSGPGSIELKERQYIYPPDPNIGWESAADQSGVFGWGWDKKYFYFAADVTDPVHIQKSSNYRAWNGDSLQLAFDTMNDASEGSFEYNDSDMEFIAWLSPQGAKLAKTFSVNDEVGAPVKGGKVEIIRKGKITSYRLAIPWSQLAELTPLPGRIFRMNFIVNQNNGHGRQYTLGLTEGIGTGKYPWIYRQFIIKK